MKIIFLLLASVFYQAVVHSQAQKDSVAVYFDFDQSSLRDASKQVIDAFLSGYRNSKGSQLVVNGFCDSMGSYAYNDVLSEKRVNAVVQYLFEKGMDRKDIVSRKGYGERNPLNSNATPEERQLNRRVDLLWIHASPSVSVVEKKDPVVESSPPEPAHDFSKEAIDSVKEGESLRLRNINFYGGRHTFLPEALTPLRELLEVMKDHPQLVIEIQGHICCFFSGRDGADYDAQDMNLSTNRAKAVFDYLVNNGIDKSRMQFKGFAGRHPLVYPERSDADRTLNRRVEVKIIKK